MIKIVSKRIKIREWKSCACYSERFGLSISIKIEQNKNCLFWFFFWAKKNIAISLTIWSRVREREREIGKKLTSSVVIVVSLGNSFFFILCNLCCFFDKNYINCHHTVICFKLINWQTDKIILHLFLLNVNFDRLKKWLWILNFFTRENLVSNFSIFKVLFSLFCEKAKKKCNVGWVFDVKIQKLFIKLKSMMGKNRKSIFWKNKL